MPLHFYLSWQDKYVQNKRKKQVYLAPQVIKAWDALQAVLIVSGKQDFKLSSATHTLQS